MNKTILTALLSGLAALSSTPLLAGEITNKIGITMVDIPAGSFVMGSCLPLNDKDRFMGKKPACDNPDTDASSAEGPQHRVNIKAFQMGKTEVTLGQFKKFIAAADRSDLVTDDFMKYNAYGDNAPVVKVSWHDAKAFIDWLNKTGGSGYRLPSEAEWEYACRANGYHKYCGSDNVNSIAWYGENSGERPHPVAGKQANAFGLYDMTGNVGEWVEDCRHDSYRGAPGDGGAWTSSCESVGRRLRGGSWSSNVRYSRTAALDSGSPGDRGHDMGFRLVRTR